MKRREAREMAARANPGAVTLGQLCDSGMVKLNVACLRCRRRGIYRITGLIYRYGAGKGLPDLRHILAADCPRMNAVSIYDHCGVYYPDLSSGGREGNCRKPR
jgi:hypothetical protein